MLNIEIQPYYIDMGRKSMKHELKAISTISDHIYKRESTKCRLLPLIIVRNNQILPNSRITNSFNYLSKKVEIGTQHDWLARFADQMKIKLELGFEYDPDEESINRYLEKNAKSKEVSITLENGKLEYIEFDDSQTSADITNVFGAFRFGLPLRKMTKLETMDAYIKMGFEEVISMTWFCAHPVIGIPCGLCTPCETVMKADMSFRLPGISRILYKFFKTNSFGKCLNYSLKKYYNKYFRKT